MIAELWVVNSKVNNQLHFRIMIIISMGYICMDDFSHFSSVYIYYTRNELASLAHSFYTCLKPPHSSDDCTLQVCIYNIYLGSIVVW